MGDSPPRQIRHLSRLIIGISALSVLLSGVTVATVTMVPFYKELQAQRERALFNALHGKAAELEQFLWRAREIALQVTSRTKARDRLEAYNAGRITLAELQSFAAPILEDAMARSADLLGVVRSDSQGRPVIEVGARLDAGHEVPDRGSVTSIRGPFRLDDKLVLSIIAPIINRTGDRVGSDRVVFDASDLEAIVRAYEAEGPTHVRLVDRTEIVPREVVAGSVEPDVQLDRQLTAIATVRPFGGRGDDGGLAERRRVWRDSGVVFAYSQIDPPGWVLLGARRAHAVDSRIRLPILQVSMVILGFSGLGAVGVGLLVRRLVRRSGLRFVEPEGGDGGHTAARQTP